MKITVLSPHRGDAACSLGLSIDAWLKAGHKVQVLNCFSRSVYAPFAETEFVHSNDLLQFVTALRAREDEAWRRMCSSGLGLIDLKMKDATRRLHKRQDEVLGLSVNPGDAVLETVQKAVAPVGGGALVLPLGLGNHIDHLLVREAMALNALATMPCAFYEDLPEALEDEVDVEAAARMVAEGLSASLVGEDGDVESRVLRKRRLALCYDSQFEDAVVERMARYCETFAGRERIWVNWRWLEGGPRV